MRASIPYGIFSTSLHWSLVFIVAVVANIVVASIIYVILDKFVNIFLRNKYLEKIYNLSVIRVRKNVYPFVDKYGEMGLALFIGIPLPGSGVYTGCLAAYLLGLDYKKTMIASIVGVIIAGVLVTFISLSGDSAFSFLLKKG